MAIDTPRLGSTDLPATSPEALSVRASPPADVLIPPLVAQSQAAFRRDLPELLKKRHAQWVAYHGDECIGFGRSQIELYQQCVRRGLKDDDFVVWGITPEWPDGVDAAEFVDA